MKTFSISICILFCLAFIRLDDITVIRDSIKNAPFIEMNSFSDSIIKEFGYVDSMKIDAKIAKQMYPDSIRNIFDFDFNDCYLFGKFKETENFFSAIILREHGVWLKTLELLVYNNKSEIISLFTLAGFSGDGGYIYNGYGHFTNDTTYIQTNIEKYYEFDEIKEKDILVSYDSIIIRTQLNYLGFITATEIKDYSNME